MKIRHILSAIVLLGFASVAQAQVPSISVTPSSGVAGSAYVVTWNCGALNASATASGAWTGSKAVTGTQNLTATTTQTYTINCTGPVPAANGTATLSWTPPTENTDGTTLTNLAGYRIDYGTSPSALTQSVTVDNGGVSTYIINGLAAGTWHFGVRARNTAGAISALSNIASKTIPTPQAPTGSASATFTLTVPPVPNPPTGLMVIDPVAYDLRLDCSNLFSCLLAYVRQDYRLNAKVGTVPIGTACSVPSVDIREAGYAQISRAVVQYSRAPSGSRIVAKCA